MGRFDKTRRKTALAQRLRRDATTYERKLWWLALSNAQMCGVSFRRQHPIGNYIVDFYAPSIKLAIETDGDQHGWESNSTRDKARTDFLLSKGILVLRFWNNEVKNEFAGVSETISSAVLKRLEEFGIQIKARPIGELIDPDQREVGERRLTPSRRKMVPKSGFATQRSERSK